MRLDVVVLYSEGCPNWRTARERVHTAARHAGRQVQVRTLAVETDHDADRWGFTGSPTILLDGRDPFTRPGAVPALACRVYPTPDGMAGSPTVDQLVAALGGCDEPLARDVASG